MLMVENLENRNEYIKLKIIPISTPYQCNIFKLKITSPQSNLPFINT